MIERYPKHYGHRDFRKNLTRKERRSDDRVANIQLPERQTMPAKKNKRRWCGGHVGREHQPEWREWMVRSRFGITWQRLTCAVCGKVLDYKRD
jgi:hypothetical protein